MSDTSRRVELPPTDEIRSLIDLAQPRVAELREPALRRRVTRKALVEAVRSAQAADIERQLAETTVERLADMAPGTVRVSALRKAGIRTAADVLATSDGRLLSIPGVGEVTVTGIRAAAAAADRSIRESTRLRLDFQSRPVDQRTILGYLFEAAAIRRHLGPLLSTATSYADRHAELLDRVQRAVGPRRLLLWGRRRAEAIAAVDELETLLRSDDAKAVLSQVRDATAALDANGTDDLWAWAAADPAGIYAKLEAETTTPTPTQQAPAPVASRWTGRRAKGTRPSPPVGPTPVRFARPSRTGRLPQSVVAKVDAVTLDLDGFKATLRKYQEFGAKYAIAQQRAILGDEMGTGKTLQALAVATHLGAANRPAYTLVVSPASVVANWAAETRRHSSLHPHVIHGSPSTRHAAFDDWHQTGGLGIVTYDGLKRLEVPDGFRADLLVVDEAHFIKNADTGRARAARRWIPYADRVLFMTGTPLENRVEEFLQLIGYLDRPLATNAASHASISTSQRFREAVAEIYLRRNQEDVIDELPERSDTDELVTIGRDERHAYYAAVAAGNFMAMRTAVTLGNGTGPTAKLVRLAEIIDEAAASGRKVLVFSFFLAALAAAANTPEIPVYGPIDGGVSPARRQQIVDEFTAHNGPAVLVAQVLSGGVGLNIQAASVVVFMEPQVKPSLEDQASARAYRMGQTRFVDVHRLVALDSVDERLVELLSGKARAFDAFARGSAIKDASTDATDPTSLSPNVLAQRIVDLEQARLLDYRDPSTFDERLRGEPE